ncbi:putative inner dynein arm light chain, axonemal Dnali1 [Tachypleus tridentatus]|uniref:putative inner dynein arm light chain, axonemal Dnali1 n=1 Tax=Tachypleus tridentatus TaxID=6853 RepID=UPI003FCF167B
MAQQQNIIPSNSSLVKYDNPILVIHNSVKRSSKKKSVQLLPQSQTESVISKSEKLPAFKQKNSALYEEILDSILPPREWEENGQLWIQHVSSTPATRLDVLNIQEQLDMKLQQRQARETGICPIRRELYDQCFDELIRQVTINCAERGLLLLRVRDEIRMTMAAYQTLYESSIAFGVRKALQAEQGKQETEGTVERLQAEKLELSKQLAELKKKSELAEKRSVEQRQLEEKKHSEEILFLKRANQQLKAQLEGIIAPKKP